MPHDRRLEAAGIRLQVLRELREIGAVRWPAKPKLRSSVGWCPWPESNQHSLRNSILSRARLPVPPQGHSRGPALVEARRRRSGRTITGKKRGSTRADVISRRLDRRMDAGYETLHEPRLAGSPI